MQEFVSVLDNALTSYGENPDSYLVASGLFSGMKVTEV